MDAAHGNDPGTDPAEDGLVDRARDTSIEGTAWALFASRPETRSYRVRAVAAPELFQGKAQSSHGREAPAKARNPERRRLRRRRKPEGGNQASSRGERRLKAP